MTPQRWMKSPSTSNWARRRFGQFGQSEVHLTSKEKGGGFTMADIRISIAGSINNPNKDFNPSAHLRQPQAQSLLQQLARNPMQCNSVDPDLLSTLCRIEAVRMEGDWCTINFPCVLQEDTAAIDQVARDAAPALVAGIESRSKRIVELTGACTYAAVGLKKMLFILVGCRVGLGRPEVSRHQWFPHGNAREARGQPVCSLRT